MTLPFNGKRFEDLSSEMTYVAAADFDALRNRLRETLQELFVLRQRVDQALKICNEHWNDNRMLLMNPPINSCAYEVRNALRSPVKIEGILFKADTPDLNGDIYSADTLRKMADGKTRFWDEETQSLIFRGDSDALA